MPDIIARAMRSRPVSADMIVPGAVTLGKFNESTRSFVGERALMSSLSSLEENLAIEFVYDVRDLVLTDLPIDVTFSVSSMSSNVATVRSKVFGSDTATDYGSTIALGNIIPMLPGEVHDYSHLDTVSTVDYEYLHVFIWVQAVDNSLLTEYFYKNMVVKVNGVERPLLLRKSYGGNYALFEPVTELPYQLTSYERSEEMISEAITSSLANAIEPYNGARIVAKGNTQNTTKIQICRTFDLNEILPTLQIGEHFVFSVNVESDSSNISTLESQLFFNNEAPVGTTSPGVQYNTSGSAVPFEGPMQTYKRSSVFNYTSYRYVHCYINAVLVDPTIATELYVNDFTLEARNSEMPLLEGTLLYRPNATDIFTELDYKGPELTTVAYHQERRSQWVGANVNINGDSISVNKAFTNKLWHEWLAEDLGFGLVRNYAISGSTLGKVGEDTNNSLALRFGTMDNDADLNIIFIGTNDASNGRVPLGTMDDRTETTFYGACHMTLSGMIDKYPVGKLAIITPLQRSTANTLPYVDVWLEVCAYYSVPCFDAYRSGGFYVGNTKVLTALMPDGLHPNAAGHKRMAQRFKQFIESL